MPELTRKDFLAAGGVALGAGALAGCGDSGRPADGSPARRAATVDASDWASIKAAYPLDPGLRHLAGFLLAAHATPVREAIERHRRGLDRDPAGYLHEHERELERGVAVAAARHLGVRPEEIALTDSTTMGLALVYGGLRLRRGDEVLTTAHDFYATHEALRLHAGRVRTVRLYGDPERASAAEIVERLTRAVTRRTRVVAITWVHSGTGVKLPLDDIGTALEAARRRGLVLAVDGVHGLGAEPAGVEDRCDALAAGTHKWLGGPRGTGIVWARGAWARMRPTIPTFSAWRGPGPASRPVATTRSSTAGRSPRRSSCRRRSARTGSWSASTRSPGGSRTAWPRSPRCGCARRRTTR